MRLLRRIEDILKQSGENVDSSLFMMLSGPGGAPVGLVFGVNNAKRVPAHAQAILQAFTAPSLKPIPVADPNVKDGDLCITVGAAPIEPGQ